MSLQSTETIDVHAHAVLDETMGAAGSHGPELTAESPPRFRAGDYELIGVKYRGSAFMDPELRLQAMDTAGIDYQVLSPNPLTYFHFIDANDAQNFCRVHNDAFPFCNRSDISRRTNMSQQRSNHRWAGHR